MRLNKAITRPIVILGVVSLFTDLASEMLYPVFPIYLTTVIGASMVQVGIIEGVAESLASFLKSFFGALSDKVGRRVPFIIAGYTLSALCKPIPGLWQTLSAAVSARAADRVGKALRTAPRDALLASYAPAGCQGTVFGFHRAMDTAGALLCACLLPVYQKINS